MTTDLCQYWMCEPRALQGFLDKIGKVSIEQIRQLDADVNKQAKETRTDKSVPLTIEAGVAIIRVQGILLQRVPAWLQWWADRGYIDLSSLEMIRRQAEQAAADPRVEKIRLLVHSPGGTVAGTMEAAEAIAEARKQKPVFAEIETISASGGYYLSSQASVIESNADAEIGSIGVYAVYYDYSKMAADAGIRAVVISSGSIKGMGVEGSVITDEQVESVREVILDMAKHFTAAVSMGRGLEPEKVEELADGRLWLAPKAKQLGLIDGIQNGKIVNELERKQAMDEKKQQEQQEAAVEKARVQEQAAAADRMRQLREAFADDPQFAMEQFEKGHTLEQAKANYADVLAAKNRELAESNEKLSAENQKLKAASQSPAPPVKANGPEPLEEGAGSPEETTDGEDAFDGYVKQYMADGLSRGQAIRKATRMHPEAHDEHLKNRTVLLKE